MGRGTVYTAAANLLFFLSGYIIHFWLGRYLGPHEYGTYGVILALMTTVNVFVTSGFPQSASKYIAEDSGRLLSVIRDSNRLQFVISGVIFSLYLLLASVIARLLNDSTLTNYIRISAIAIPVYGFCYVYSSGYINGLRWFGKQSVTSILMSITKVLSTILLVLLGFNIYGAIGGYILAALVGFISSWLFLKPMRGRSESFGIGRIVGFGIPATIFSLVFFLLLSVDLYSVKALGIGDAEVGYYTSTSTISKISYFLFAALAATILPSISRSTAANNVEQTGNYISKSLRYMFILLVPLTLLISSTSESLITLVYSSRYIEAASSLRILIFGLGFLSVFLVLSNIIIGAGKPKVTVWMALPLLAMDIVLNVILIPRYGLTGAAWATTATGFAGMCAAAIYVYWKFKALVNALSALKIVLASVVVYLIALNVSVPPAWLVPLYLGLAVLYAGLLWIGGEIKREDIELVRKIFNIRKVSSK